MKLKKFSCLLLFWCMLVNVHELRSQGGSNQNNFSRMTDFLPPPPNASAIIQYGGINTNKNTGAPAISIPLFTLKSKKLSTGVSISYNATGIKVDEIASRVGIGWALQAGGVVTRTVRGTPDEVNPRIVPWVTPGFNVGTFNFMNAVANSDNWSGVDSEPDLFNFNINGYSGTFVFDQWMNIVQVNKSSIKIYNDFQNSSWNFRIITPDGVVHYFGGISATEKTKRDQICAKIFETYLPTAWYIKSIVHPNGDSISFKYTPLEYVYETGVSQTMHWSSNLPIGGGTVGICANTLCQASPLTTCINVTRTQGVLLDEIVTNGLSKIKFYYASRNDCGDKLVSRAEMINTIDNSIINAFDFSYNQVVANSSYNNESRPGHNYTPYLIGITEKSGDNSLSRPYYFSYNNPAGRAPRLSFSQDHWGLFNGKVNPYFIPPPDDRQIISKFPFATANRQSDAAYAIMGMLNKVIYPTGGIDSIIYELNTYKNNLVRESRHHLSCASTGSGFNTQVVKSLPFAIDNNQDVEVIINCIDNSGIGEYDSLHNKGRVEIVHNASSAICFLSKYVYAFKFS